MGCGKRIGVIYQPPIFHKKSTNPSKPILFSISAKKTIIHAELTGGKLRDNNTVVFDDSLVPLLVLGTARQRVAI